MHLTGLYEGNIFASMIKKVTIFGLLGIILFGMSAPTLAYLMPHTHECCMPCCEEAQHRREPQTCSTEIGQPDMMQHRVSTDSVDPDCPMLASCLPGEIPNGLEIQSEAPTFKTKFKYNVDLSSLQTVPLHDTGSRLTCSVPRSVPDAHSAREILTTHSVLII